jgi:hypothetical protein
MTPERFRWIAHVFDAAADVPSDERDAVLARLCGDDAALRAEVESLLAASAGADEQIHRTLRREADLALERAREHRAEPPGLRRGR